MTSSKVGLQNSEEGAMGGKHPTLHKGIRNYTLWNIAHEVNLATTLRLTTRHAQRGKTSRNIHHTTKPVGCNTPIDSRSLPTRSPTPTDKYPAGCNKNIRSKRGPSTERGEQGERKMEVGGINYGEGHWNVPAYSNAGPVFSTRVGVNLLIPGPLERHPDY